MSFSKQRLSPARRFCANYDPGLFIEVEDDLVDITVRIRLRDERYFLSIGRNEAEGAYVASNMESKGTWTREAGIGTLVVNTALQYLRSLADEDLQYVQGFLYPSHDDPLPDQRHRIDFAARFGARATGEGANFRVRLADLTLVPAIIDGVYPTIIPWSEFQPCP